MPDRDIDKPEKIKAGMVASVIVHAVLAAALFLTLPGWPRAPEEPDSVPVELVKPPPEKPKAPAKPADKKADKPKQAAASAPKPQAFESAPQGEAREQAAPDATPAPLAAKTEEPASDVKAPQDPKATPDRRTEEAETDPEKPDATPPAPETLATQNPRHQASDQKASPPASKTPTPAPVPKDETPPPAKPEIPPTEKPLKSAKKLFSEKALSNPRIREALGKLPANRRIVQICSIEALEQVRHDQPQSFPDILVPFSETGGQISPKALNASGGAFRSRDKWYGIDFNCEVDAEALSIVSFRYALGAAIPRSEWQERKLPMN